MRDPFVYGEILIYIDHLMVLFNCIRGATNDVKIIVYENNSIIILPCIGLHVIILTS